MSWKGHTKGSGHTTTVHSIYLYKGLRKSPWHARESAARGDYRSHLFGLTKRKKAVVSLSYLKCLENRQD